MKTNPSWTGSWRLSTRYFPEQASGTRFSPEKVGRVLEKQLGRRAECEYEVVRSCDYGWPVVITNAPLTRAGAPNPNVYYLTCPYLRKKVAVLEDSGEIEKIQERVRADARLAKTLAHAHREHARAWKKMAARVTEKPAVHSLKIAGARDSQSIKCLHAHYAYFLAHPEYLIGELIAGGIGDPWCDDDRCSRFLA